MFGGFICTIVKQMLCKTQAWAAEILDLGFLRGSEQVRSLRAQWYFSRILLSFQVSFHFEKKTRESKEVNFLRK